MDISEKIKIGRESKGWTQLDLSKNSGVSLDSIKRYESKNSNITINNLIKIADSLGLNLDFFRDDNEAVTKLLLTPVTKSKKSVTNLLLSQEKNLSKSQNPSKTLSDKGKLPIHSTTDELSNNDDLVSIPFLESITASAGDGAYNDNEDSEQLTFQKSFLRQYFGIISFNNLSIIIGKGDSMYPTLPESCYLLVQLGNVNDGEICIARIDDELYVKRLQKRPKLKLFSDNKNYEPIELEGENFEILGRVVGYFKKTTI
ncbi:XRE family transcriptional regulator [Helicobacter pullorum]|uniref:XRE family transcriptional regulator n=1 Tax=Helicobacter pullorum TaxID=35818 RepID=UPI00255C6CCB|nr:XRE family transcriptional regulator [Helicobacter pullorum]